MNRLICHLLVISVSIVYATSFSPLETNDGLMHDNFDEISPEQQAIFIRDDVLKHIDKRQTSGGPKGAVDNTDVMVKNILKWLQSIYGQNNRKTRQGAREYLPPINTEKPRPFQAGYPAAGPKPSPSFDGYDAPYKPAGGPNPTQPASAVTTISNGPLTIDLGTGDGGEPSGAGNVETNEIYTTAMAPGPSAPAESLPGFSDTIPGPVEETPGPAEVAPSSPEAAPGPAESFPTYTPDGTAQSPTYASPTDDDINHPPHIHAIDVQCSKEAMTVNIEFNREYNGIIYSKGYFNNPSCRYVNENSGQVKYSFTLSLNNCGTEFISAFETEGQSYLENVLVLQNEAGIQEVWDSIKTVRCLWEGNVNQALSVALSVGMLTQEIVTFSGDTAMARLDIQVGRGPFAPAANGLVKIGEIMTLVVSVTGDPDFDIQVRDCRAHDDTNTNNVALTDSNGCVLKPKLFGAFQKTRETQNTGASIIAFAYFSAFKFPDVMDLTLECNIELCKTDCQMCPDPSQKIDPGRRRRRDTFYDQMFGSKSNESRIADPVKIRHHLQVILPEDVLSDRFDDENSAILKLEKQGDSICMSVSGFLFSFVSLALLLIVSAVFSGTIWLKYQRIKLKY